MNLIQRYSHHAVSLICALFLCAHTAAHADDLAEANKLFRQGSHAQALEKTNAYLANKPKDAQARFLKGLILTEQGKSSEAIQIFSGLTNDYPELPEPYNNLAVLYASQGNYDKAKLALEKAIRTHPSYSTAHENLGDIYAKMASQAYDRALQLDRGNPATQTKLAMIENLFAAKDSKSESPAVEVKNPVQPVVASAPEVKTSATQQLAAAPEVKVSAPTTPAQAPAPVKPAAITPAEQPKPVVAKEADTQAKSLDAILKTVDAWAAAWSKQDVDGYLSFYSAEFKPADGESRKSWEATRRERVSTPKSIDVKIGKASVKFTDSTHATVKFRQSYRASHHRSTASKTLLMVKADGNWRILEETSK
jgi:tetratricopeptide (TPR) repeat protein